MTLRSRKIALVGSRSVGKSALTVQYVDGHFVDSYYPTIENTFEKTITYNGEKFLTEIVDTAGQDEYSILQSKHFIGIHGYLLVYSVASRHSFEMITNIRDKINNTLGSEKVPMVVIGNKADLPPAQHVVTASEGQALGRDMGVPWIEASARTSDNVTKAFELVIGEIEKLENGDEPKKDGCQVM